MPDEKDSRKDSTFGLRLSTLGDIFTGLLTYSLKNDPAYSYLYSIIQNSYIQQGSECTGGMYYSTTQIKRGPIYWKGCSLSGEYISRYNKCASFPTTLSEQLIWLSLPIDMFSFNNVPSLNLA